MDEGGTGLRFFVGYRFMSRESRVILFSVSVVVVGWCFGFFSF